MRRKKQGASLIVVVIVFMFLFTVSTAMLSMVVGNYKARVTESKRVENLYASDSGLDVAYNVIGKTFDAATKYGYWKVEELKNETNKGPYNDKYKDIEDEINQLKSDITTLKAESPSVTRSQSDINKDIVKKKNLIEEDENIKNILCDEEFKRAFRNFINKTAEVSDSENVPDTQLKDSINHHKYVSEITSENIDTDKPEQTIEFGIVNKSGNSPELKAEISGPGSSNETKGIYSTSDGGKHSKTVTFSVYGEQYYDVLVTSDFYTERDKENNETNKRQLKAQYKVSVPNYKDIYFENSSGDLKEYLATKDRALTIFGDMNVNNVTGLTVSGDIFVKDVPDTIPSDNKVYGKYFGGITLNNSGDVNFKNNVITRGTFNIQNTTTPASANVTTTVGENIYARNIYVGKKDNSSLAGGNTILNISNNVIINNDLALNADNATINIGHLYGINDENINDKAQSSSSIIVNGNNSSSINIEKSAYLMGTAHIATDGDYQTAESGAVKGNYIAYCIPLTDEEKSKFGITGTEQFKYDNPLQLLSPPDPETAQQQKENHFRAYWDGKIPNANAGGIIWPHNLDGSINQNNIWSSGVIVYQNKDGGDTQVIPSHYEGDLESQTGVIYSKRVEFAQYAYKFGQDANIYDYTNARVISGDSLINTANITSNILENQQNKGEYAIFNGDKNKEIKIKQGSGSEDEIENADSNTITIYVGNHSDSYILNAVIATAGNVSIESGVTIKGCIIAEGNLDINGNHVTITYDQGVIERVQAQNLNTFKAVFGESIWADTDSASSSTEPTTEDSSSNYDLKKFLQNELWKIIK
ncbi:MAG: hypothetical protein LLF98_07320 [Clostridium sp.]|uniref:hypothetical protein n=1 Tax=Clostridium sp. TaxID=1506 RepID=UPI0025BDCB55|nr:hypothetical protein [Clostridium sp.]MCE5221062.1 hypothetical protein [Clostridium sp.]